MSYLKWGIRELSRSDAERSYTGTTWQSAGVPRDLVPIGFHDESEAKAWALALTRYNLVGFEAFRLPDS